MDYVTTGIKLLSGSSHLDLANEIADRLGMHLCDAELGKFSDGETSIRVNETVRGQDVYLIQPTSNPVNDHLMELMILADAMKRASAGSITAVLPYYGYARQDRTTRARDPISAKLVADLMTASGINRVLTMELHCAQIQGFFNIPVDHLKGSPVLVSYYMEKFQEKTSELVVVSPDLGSVARSREFAQAMNLPLAIVDKRRPQDNVSEVMNIIGDVDGKDALLVDDMIDTAGTICNAADALKERGAKHVYACCTHPVLSGPAIERIEASAIEELVVLNTIKIPQEKLLPKMKLLSVAPIFADAIYRIHSNLPVSKLFSLVSM